MPLPTITLGGSLNKKPSTEEDRVGISDDEFLNRYAATPAKRMGLQSTKPNTTEESAGEPGLLSDIGNLLGKGSVSVVRGASDVANKFVESTPVGAIANVGLKKLRENILGGTDDEVMKPVSDRFQDNLSTSQKEAGEKAWVKQDDPDKAWYNPTNYSLGEAWNDPRSYMGGIVESLPSIVTTMTPSMWLARGTYVAQLSKGVSKEAAAEVAAKTAQRAGMLTEGLLSGGQSAVSVRDKIMDEKQVPQSVLEQSSAYQNLITAGATPEQARQQLANDSSSMAFLLAGVTTGVFGGQGDKFLARAFTSGIDGNLLKRVGKGILAEGLAEEAPQSGMQQLSENIAMKQANPNQDIGEGVANAAVGGAVLGGAMGGAFGLRRGGSKDKPEEPKLEEKPIAAPKESTTPVASVSDVSGNFSFNTANPKLSGLAAASDPDLSVAPEDKLPRAANDETSPSDPAQQLSEEAQSLFDSIAKIKQDGAEELKAQEERASSAKNASEAAPAVESQPGILSTIEQAKADLPADKPVSLTIKDFGKNPEGTAVVVADKTRADLNGQVGVITSPNFVWVGGANFAIKPNTRFTVPNGEQLSALPKNWQRIAEAALEQKAEEQAAPQVGQSPELNEASAAPQPPVTAAAGQQKGTTPNSKTAVAKVRAKPEFDVAPTPSGEVLDGERATEDLTPGVDRPLYFAEWLDQGNGPEFANFGKLADDEKKSTLAKYQAYKDGFKPQGGEAVQSEPSLKNPEQAAEVNTPAAPDKKSKSKVKSDKNNDGQVVTVSGKYADTGDDAALAITVEKGKVKNAIVSGLNGFRVVKVKRGDTIKDVVERAKSDFITDDASKAIANSKVIEEKRAVRAEAKAADKKLTEEIKSITDEIISEEQRVNSELVSKYGVPESSVKLVDPPEALAPVTGVIESLFPVKVQFYSPLNEQIDELTEGFFRSNEPGTIYVSTRSQNPFMFVAGHEFAHSIEKRNPALWREFVKRIFQYTDVKELQSQLKILKGDLTIEAEATGARRPTDKQVAKVARSEFPADLVGSMWMRPSFWKKLMDSSQPDTRPLIKKMMDAVADFISNLKSKFSDRGLRGAKAFKNVVEVEREVVSMIQQFADLKTAEEGTLDSRSSAFWDEKSDTEIPFGALDDILQERWTDAFDMYEQGDIDAAELMKEIDGIERAYNKNRRAEASSAKAAQSKPDEDVSLSRKKKQVPEAITQILKNLTPQERMKVNDRVGEKVAALLTTFPPAEEMAAVAYAGKAKRGWYKNSADAIAGVFGPDAPRFAMLLSALSPQTSVETNLRNALNVWEGWLAAGRPSDEAAILKIMGERVEGSGTEASVLGAWRNNAFRALANEDVDPTSLMSGPKVNSFYQNLIGNVVEVTNDTWMANWAKVSQTLFKGSNFNPQKGDSGKGSGYLAMNALTRQAAEILTERTGETWTPAEVQETVWTWTKTLYENAPLAGLTAAEVVELGGMTDDMLQSTSDFSALFLAEEYASILEKAGYGEELRKLENNLEATQRQPGDDTGAERQAGPFAEDTQLGYEIASARRLDELRGQGGSESAKVQNKAGEVSLSRKSRLDQTPAGQSALSKIGGQSTGLRIAQRIKALVSTGGDRFIQSAFDKYYALRKLDPYAYVLARMSGSTDGALESMMQYGQVFVDKDGALDVKRGKGFAEVLAKVGDEEYEDFAKWMVGNRAADLKAQGRENLLDDTEIKAMQSLNQGKDAQGRQRAVTYAAARDELHDFNNSVLKVALDTGLIKPELYRTLAADKNYIPFYRMADDDSLGIDGPSLSTALVNQVAFHRLKGGTNNIGDPISNIMMNWSHILSASMKNQAGMVALESMANIGAATQTREKQKGGVTVMRNGKPEHYLINDPMLAESVISLAPVAMNDAAKVLAPFKNLFTQAVTSNPAFKVKNLIRDAVSAVAVNQISYNPIANVIQGMGVQYADQDTAASMLAGGGSIMFGTFNEGDRAAHIERLIKSGVPGKSIMGVSGTPGAFMSAVWEGYNSFSNKLENVNRGAIYKQLRDQGISHLEASFLARDTMDFSLQGSAAAVRFLGQVVPFFNARMQSMYKLGRGAVENKGRFAIVAGAVILASTLLHMANKGDDEYDKREDWDRDNFWWFRVGGNAFRIPKPFELGSLGTVAERMYDLAYDDTIEGRVFAQRMGSILLDQFAMNPIPQAVKPLIQLGFNKDWFTGNQIEPASTENLPKEYRAGNNTSYTAQLLGQVTSSGDIGLSPAQIDFLVKSYTAWIGATAVDGMDMMLRAANNEPERPTPRKVAGVPEYFLGGLAKELPAQSSKYVSSFYDQQRKFSLAAKEFALLRERGEDAKAEAFEIANEYKLGMAGQYEATGKNLSEINRQIKQILNDKGMSANEKKATIDELYAERNAIAREVELERIREK